MQSKETSPEAYIESLPEDRQPIIAALRDAIAKNIPPHFEEQMGYGMFGWVVPHHVYPAGVSLRPKTATPFSRYRLAEEPHRPLPHGHVHRTETEGVVRERVAEAFI